MRRINPSMPPQVAERILSEEHGDLRARWILNELASKLFDAGERKAACSLIHACAYLEDRVTYELAPHPKNKIKLLIEKCAHGKAGKHG